MRRKHWFYQLYQLRQQYQLRGLFSRYRPHYLRLCATCLCGHKFPHYHGITARPLYKSYLVWVKDFTSHTNCFIIGFVEREQPLVRRIQQFKKQHSVKILRLDSTILPSWYHEFEPRLVLLSANSGQNQRCLCIRTRTAITLHKFDVVKGATSKYYILIKS